MKKLIIAIIAAIAFVVCFGVQFYLPLVEAIRKSWKDSGPAIAARRAS